MPEVMPVPQRSQSRSILTRMLIGIAAFAVVGILLLVYELHHAARSLGEAIGGAAAWADSVGASLAEVDTTMPAGSIVFRDRTALADIKARAKLRPVGAVGRGSDLFVATWRDSVSAASKQAVTNLIGVLEPQQRNHGRVTIRLVEGPPARMTESGYLILGPDLHRLPIYRSP
jgi:hypothetical protein